LARRAGAQADPGAGSRGEASTRPLGRSAIHAHGACAADYEFSWQPRRVRTISAPRATAAWRKLAFAGGFDGRGVLLRLLLRPNSRGGLNSLEDVRHPREMRPIERAASNTGCEKTYRNIIQGGAARSATEATRMEDLRPFKGRRLCHYGQLPRHSRPVAQQAGVENRSPKNGADPASHAAAGARSERSCTPQACGSSPFLDGQGQRVTK